MFELTLAQLQQQQKEQLEALVEDAGGPTHLSRMLNIHPMTVKGWLERNRISKEGARLVESHPTLGEYYKAVNLRPDIEF